MNDKIQRIIELINEARIQEAMEAIEALGLSSPDLGKLKKEFRSGTYRYDSDYSERLIYVVKSLAKRFDEPKPTSSHNTIEVYITLLTKLLEEIKSSRNPESSTLDIPVPPVLQGYEKIIGDRPTLTNINWLRKGLIASKSVCRVVLPNGENGTGFVMEGGYLLTNYHVLEGKKKVAEAKIEFNFEEDADGKAQTITTYALDPSDYKYSPKEVLDYSYVKIKDDPQNPLGQWGTLAIEDSGQAPEVGQPIIIIQHPSSREYPNGGIKKIAFENNDILSVWKQYLFYKTDTLPGSSGAPVLNKDWKVVALHHAGKSAKEGGMVINAEGKKAPANRGVLIKDIMADIAEASAANS